MGITRKTLTRHELIGLDVEVLGAQNESNVGISGKIVDETQKTLAISTADKVRGCHESKTFAGIASAQVHKRVFKSGTRFCVALPDGEKVEVGGDEILGRPWERISK